MVSADGAVGASVTVTRRPLVGLLAYQRSAVRCDARFTWNCWARQTGKSFTFSLRRVLRGLNRRRNQIILSAGERQSREVMEKVRLHCRALQVWHEWHGYGFFRGTSFRQLEVRLPGGVRIIGLPANPMTARGFTGDVFLDEFAMHSDDAAIWSALFPTLLRGEGELDVASTPRGRKNVFYRLRENRRFRHQTMTLAKAVAAGLAVDVATMRQGIGDESAWRQEFCCEFVDEATSFMTHALIRSCQDARLSVSVDWACLGRRGAQVYVGVDVGRYRDVTAVWLWERLGDTLVTRGVEVLRAAPFAEQEAAIGRILGQRAVQRCCIDATGLGLQLAERLAEQFGEHRLERVMITAALKSELAGGLRVLAERGCVQIPVDEAIVNDWHSIARLVTSGGHVRFDADRSSGGHGDRFWAAALGIHAADELVGDAGFVTSGRLAFAREGIW
ncbi:MAG: terminase family protein [Phycisphaerae bacterium]|nr:terminase family protein [Phycisphaerae bacterium]